MEDIGIMQNPCHDLTYNLYHNSPISTLSQREFLILQKLRENCVDFQEDIEWGINVCKDSVYISLLNTPNNKLTTQESLYLAQLKDDCEELKDDLDDDYAGYWPSEYAMLNDTTLALYDPPGSAKTLQTIGGVLFVPGVVGPIVGSVLLSNNQYTSDPFEFDVGIKRLIGWVLLGVGIACDCAGTTLLSVGYIKQNKNKSFEKLRDEYEKSRKNRLKEISFNLTFDF